MKYVIKIWCCKILTEWNTKTVFLNVVIIKYTVIVTCFQLCNTNYKNGYLTKCP